MYFYGTRIEHARLLGLLDHGHPGEAGAKAIAVVVAEAMHTQTSSSGLRSDPRCAEVDGIGPGKAGWMVPE